MPDNNQNKNQKKQSVYSAAGAQAMTIAFELGFIIALPIVAMALAGKWLDDKYHAGYFIYIGIALAVVSSTIWLAARFKGLIDKLEKAAGATANKEINNNNKENEPENKN